MCAANHRCSTTAATANAATSQTTPRRNARPVADAISLALPDAAAKRSEPYGAACHEQPGDGFRLRERAIAHSQGTRLLCENGAHDPARRAACAQHEDIARRQRDIEVMREIADDSRPVGVVARPAAVLAFQRV